MTTLSVTRPYIRDRHDALRTILEQNASNPWVLAQLILELRQRKSLAAKALMQDVQQRLLEVLPKFPWPSTEAGEGSGKLDAMDFQYRNGVLSYCGYRVGTKGVPANERHGRLDFIFANGLPQVFCTAYLHKWGKPGSAARLQKLAESIAALARNAKRRKGESHQLAISDWEADLAYLKATYYIGRFDFPWPTVATLRKRRH